MRDILLRFYEKRPNRSHLHGPQKLGWPRARPTIPKFVPAHDPSALSWGVQAPCTKYHMQLIVFITDEAFCAYYERHVSSWLSVTSKRLPRWWTLLNWPST